MVKVVSSALVVVVVPTALAEVLSDGVSLASKYRAGSITPASLAGCVLLLVCLSVPLLVEISGR